MQSTQAFLGTRMPAVSGIGIFVLGLLSCVVCVRDVSPMIR